MTVRILRGDVRERLADLPANSVHCVVTSPPYWGLRDYQIAGQLGLEPTPQAHVEAMVAVFREVRRVLRPDGVCWVNYGDSYATGTTAKRNPTTTTGAAVPAAWAERSQAVRAGTPAGCKTKDLLLVPFRFALAMQDDGWWLRSVLPWVKRNGMPESIKDRPATAVEYVFLFSKSARYFYDADAVRRERATDADYKMPDNWDTGPGGHGSFRRQGREKGAPARGRSTYGKHKLGDNVPISDRRAISPKYIAADKRRLSGENETSTLGIAEGRNFRNADLFFESLQPPHGLLTDEQGEPLALDVPPQPFKAAHFATFPTKLIEPLIKAGSSEKGCCSSCGAPWVRVVAKSAPDADWQKRCGADAAGGYEGEATKDFTAAGAQNASDVKRRILAGLGASKTVGWLASCGCADATIVPCTVLDPFAGSGTTGLVADRLGREAILIELNDDYAAMAEKRIHGDAGMFAKVGA